MNTEQIKELSIGEFTEMYAFAVKSLIKAQKVNNQQGVNAYACRCADLEEARPSLVEFIEDQWVKMDLNQPVYMEV